MRISILSRRRALRRALVAGVAILAAAAASGIAYASIPDGNGVIHGCYQKAAGVLRVIDPATASCHSSEVALNWNQTGPAGPRGATGAAGPAGPTGATGPSDAWHRYDQGPYGLADPMTEQLFNLPAGNFLVHGTAIVNDPVYAAHVRCALIDARSEIVDTIIVAITSPNDAASLTLEATESNATAGSWELQCSSETPNVQVSEIRFFAIDVGAVHR